MEKPGIFLAYVPDKEARFVSDEEGEGMEDMDEDVRGAGWKGVNWME